ncbi:alpha/beta fold hydrolase [Rhizobium sp. Root1204]|uniref:alpha/beta hydrolase n=1 Tax=Rhizobium sp. Root1204 TaxID=1736428 RepID=UPI003296BFD7
MATAGRPVKDGPVGLFVHGYNYTYQEGLFRLAQIAVDAKIKGSPVLFSWPSEGTLAGYIADRDAALYSRDDLVSVISSLAAQPGGKPIILFGHSMGGFLIMEALRQLKLNGREDVLKRLAVFLAAPDIDTDVFLRQLETIGPMVAPLTLFVSKDDRALLVSSLFGSDRQRAGRLDINDPAVTQAAQKYRLRVIDITALPGPDETGHNRFANLAGLEPQFASFKSQQGASPAEVGAFVFDAAAIAVASPFRLVGKIVTVSAATPK